MRTLVPPMPTPYTLGVERVEAKVQAFLELPAGAVPVLQDAQLEQPGGGGGALRPGQGAGGRRARAGDEPGARARGQRAVLADRRCAPLGAGPVRVRRVPPRLHRRALDRATSPRATACTSRWRSCCSGVCLWAAGAQALRPPAPAAGVRARGRHRRPLRHQPPLPRGPPPRLRRRPHHPRADPGAGAARRAARARARAAAVAEALRARGREDLRQRRCAPSSRRSEAATDATSDVAASSPRAPPRCATASTPPGPRAPAAALDSEEP